MSVLPELPSLKVLVVDDDEDNRRIVSRHLPSPPMQVATAADGRAAIEAATADPPDVILIDLEMPVMDGLEATARLRALEREAGRTPCVIIGFSGHHDDATRRRSLAAGCDAYLAKPVSRAMLRGAIVEAVNGARAVSAPVTTPAGAPDPRPDDPVAIDPDLAPMIGDFLGSRRPALDELDAVLGAEQRGRLRTLAHRLAGSFGLYGFRWAASQCHRLERDAEHAERAQLADMLAALRRHLETVELRTDAGALRARGGRG